MQGAEGFRLREQRTLRARLADAKDQDVVHVQRTCGSNDQQRIHESKVTESSPQPEAAALVAAFVQPKQSRGSPPALDVTRGWVTDDAAASAAVSTGDGQQNADSILTKGLKKAFFLTEFEKANQKTSTKMQANSAAPERPSEVASTVEGSFTDGPLENYAELVKEPELEEMSPVVADGDGECAGPKPEGSQQLHSGEIRMKEKSKKKSKRMRNQNIDVMEELKNTAQIAKLQKLVQKDPTVLQHFLEALTETNPGLLETISMRSQEFMDMLLGDQQHDYSPGGPTAQKVESEMAGKINDETDCVTQEQACTVQKVEARDVRKWQYVARARRRIERACKPLTTSTHPLAVMHSAFTCAVCKATTNLMMCSACKCVRFCSRDHQRQFKPRHQDVCKFLASCRGGLLEQVSGKDWHSQGFKQILEVFMKYLGDRHPATFEYEQLLQIPRCRKCGKLPATLPCDRSRGVGYCSEPCRDSDSEWRLSWQCKQVLYTQEAAQLMHQASTGIPFEFGKPDGLFPDNLYDEGWPGYLAHCGLRCNGTPFMALPRLTQHVLIDKLSYPMAVLEALYKAGRRLEVLCAGSDFVEVHMLLPELAAHVDMEKYLDWLYRAGSQVKSLTIRVVSPNILPEGGVGDHKCASLSKCITKELTTRGCTVDIHYYRMQCHDWMDKALEVSILKRKQEHDTDILELKPDRDYEDIRDPTFRVCYSPMFDLWARGNPHDAWAPVLERLAAADDGAPLVVTERSWDQLHRDKQCAEQSGLVTLREPHTSNFTSCFALPDDDNTREDNPSGLLIWNMGHIVFEGQGQEKNNSGSVDTIEKVVAEKTLAADNLNDNQVTQTDSKANVQLSELAKVDLDELKIRSGDSTRPDVLGLQGEGMVLLSMPGPWSFDGTNFEDVPYGLEGNPEASFSVQLCAKSTGGKGFRSPLTSRDEKPHAGFMFYADADDQWAFWVGDADTGYWAGISGPPVSVGVWTSLHGIVDVMAGEVRFYVDKELAGTRAGVKFIPNRRRPFRLGAGRSERSCPLFCFTGEVKDVIVQSCPE